MAKEVTYIALTTLNAQMSGWKIVVAGTDKARVEEAARKAIGDIRTDYGTDIYRETEQKNLVVVSKTSAKRDYGFDWNEFMPDYNDPNNRYRWID